MDIIEWASKFNQSAIAITDRDSLAGVVPFAKAAKDAGIKPIIGCELTEPNVSHRTAIILARNRKGYEFISQTITSRHLDKNFDFLQTLLQADENVIVLVHDPNLLTELSKHPPGNADSLSAKTPGNGFPGYDQKREEANCLPPLAGGLRGGNIYAEIIASDNTRTFNQNYRLAREAERLGIKTVITAASYGTDETRWETHKVLRAIGLLTSVNRLKDSDYLPRDRCLKHIGQLTRWRERFPGAIERTNEIAAMCDYTPTFYRWISPQFQVPNGETDHVFLSRIAHDGLKLRMPNPSDDAKRRLKSELSMIKRLGFSSYFLTVWDIVRFARERDIPCIGRGSAANSLVSYCLQLTHVDPIKSDLFFERFLNPWRNVPPDIDIDFSWKRRDEIIEWVYERHGRDRVAMISTHVTFRMRSAIREVAKAYGIPENEALSVSKKIPWGWDGSMSKLSEHYPKTREFPFDLKIWQDVLAIAGKIQGFVQHLSIHCAGIVITPDPITNHLPLQKSGQSGKGLAVTQFEMRAVEAVGLIKIDLLGNRSLGVFTDIMDTLKRSGQAPDINNQNMVFNNAKTIELIRSGKTMGCFYIESPAMRSLLQKLHVVDFEGLTAASSVIRPGVAESGMMDEYIKRHNNQSEVEYLHPKLEQILKLTYGVMIYQEDVIRVVHYIAGMTLAEADLLRRAMSGKGRGRKSMRQFEDDFIHACIERGIDIEIATEIWRQIKSFAGYSFCKGHSASFAILSFQMAYLKVHFPALFMASVMSNFGGFYSLSAYISEARRLGVKILPPDINFSKYLYVAEIAPTPALPLKGEGVVLTPAFPLKGEGVGPTLLANGKRENCNSICSCLSRNFIRSYLPPLAGGLKGGENHQHIRLGFCIIKNLEQKTINKIIAKRESDGVFKSLHDFVRRTSITPSQLTILIECGALDSLGTPRPQLLMQSQIYNKPLKQSPAELFPSHDPAPQIAKRADFTTRKKLQMELKHFGRIVTCHPLECFTDEIKKLNIVPASEMILHAQKRITMVGWMVAQKTIRTRKSGRLMKFFSMEDLSGTYEVTMFPAAYERYAHLAKTHGPFVIRGKVEEHFGVASLNCVSIELLVDL